MQVALLVMIPDEGAAEVAIDLSHLERVLFNILGNAIKHASLGGRRVCVAMLRRADEIDVLVSDNGPGIEASVRHRLFQKGVVGRQAGGRGLGLFIAGGIVRRYGGRIWATDSSGGGASFGFALARARAASLSPAPQLKDAARVPSEAALVVVLILILANLVLVW